MGTKLNRIQASIMRRLFEKDGLRFSEINIEKIPSDLFSYHLRQLLKNKLVEKLPDQTYRLSHDGKMRAIMLKPDDSQFIEQGFSAVVNMAVKIEDGRELFLVQERNKVPYKGTIAFSGDKIYYGEDVASAAKRAFLLQTGLEADVELRSIWHIKEKYESKIIQDKFFYMHLATNLRGQLQPVGLTGNNLWMTIEELEASDKTLHGFINTLHSVQSLPLTFHETTIEVASY